MITVDVTDSHDHLRRLLSLETRDTEAESQLANTKLIFAMWNTNIHGDGHAGADIKPLRLK